jgi:DNA-binding MarR family transcriptional regulator
MSSKQKFVDMIDNEFFSKVVITEIDPDIVSYWEAFKSVEEKEKPKFTENGKLILQYMRDNSETTSWKAKDIGEGLFLSSRTVSGGLRKLVTDKFVEKVEGSPTIYTLTDLGKTIDID